MSPNQLRTVAERRFDDAQYLRRSGKNKYANGAMYLAGFVLECRLKAALLEEFAWLQTPTGNLSARSKADRRLYDLCYRRHDLGAILERLPRIRERLAAASGVLGRGAGLLQVLQRLCAEWTIYARYSPRQAVMTEANQFLDRVKELKKWLR